MSSTAVIAKLPHPGMTGYCPLAPYLYLSRKASLTGNSEPDLIVITGCVGTGPGPTTVEVYRQATSTQPPMRATLMRTPRTNRGPYPESVAVSGHTVTISSIGYKPGECQGCASIAYTQRFKFNESAVTAGPLTISPDPANGYGTVVVDGTNDDTYQLDIWARDRITNCADHAYGAAMIAFLRAHPCSNAHRTLTTINVNGREAVLSIITVTFPPSPGDTYGYNASSEFQKLENGSGTGSLNDLFKEGHKIVGIATSIPASEAFLVAGEDAGSAVFDAWWVQGATADQDPSLTAMENALFLSKATDFD